MYECLVNSNKNNMEAPAIKFFGKKISYSQMIDKIDAIASAFSRNGIVASDRVVVLGLNTPEIICSVYAINKLGAIACMEYITQTESDLIKITKEYKSKYAVVIDNVYEKYSESLIEAGIEKIFLVRSYQSMPFAMRMIAKGKMKIKNVTSHTIELDKEVVKNYIDLNCVSKGDDIAIVLSTSGTTGIPKRAELTNDAINALAYQGHYIDIELNVGKTMLTPAPPFFAFGISLTMHFPLCCGVCLILSMSPDPDFVTNQFIKYKPSLFMAGPVFIDKIMASKKAMNMDMSFVTAIELGGASVSAEYSSKVDTFFKQHNYSGNIYVGYGMTELAACSTTEQKNANRPGTVGIPICDVNVKIVDTERGEELPYDESGEILISSPCMMKQYFNNQAETDEIIEVDENGVRWIHTGDMGMVDEDGFITVVGRIKRIALTKDPVSQGMAKLYPDYIEHTLKDCPMVEECAVITVEDEERVNVAIAFVVLTGNGKIADIEAYMRDNLAPYNVPQKCIALDTMPIRPNGKTDYILLESKIHA